MTDNPICARCGNSDFEIKFYQAARFSVFMTDGELAASNYILLGDGKLEHIACRVCGALNEETGVTVKIKNGWRKFYEAENEHKNAAL